jgi:hypothetical protein
MGGNAKGSHGVCTFFPGYLKLRVPVQRGCNTVGLNINSDSELSNQISLVIPSALYHG